MTVAGPPVDWAVLRRAAAEVGGETPAAGEDRATLAFICEAYHEDEAPDDKGNMQTRVVLRFHPRLAPEALGKPFEQSTLRLRRSFFHDLTRTSRKEQNCKQTRCCEKFWRPIHKTRR